MITFLSVSHDPPLSPFLVIETPTGGSYRAESLNEGMERLICTFAVLFVLYNNEEFTGEAKEDTAPSMSDSDGVRMYAVYLADDTDKEE